MNWIKTLTSAGLLAAFGFVATDAHAGTLYRLDGSEEISSSMEFNYLDGVSITATAQVKKGGVYHDADVTRNENGLGVRYGDDDSKKVDGVDAKDTVWLSFSESLDIAGFKFRVVDAVDEFVRLFKADGSFLAEYALSPLVSDGTALLDLTSLDYSGTRIGLQAMNETSSWRIDWLEVKDVPVPEFAAFDEEVFEAESVPTPAAAGLGLLGLAATVMARRRKNA